MVGPFQGNPACIHIPVGKGVCGTAVQRDETVLVPDVHQFPGHIACDSASQSEIVIPIHMDGSVVAVLDIDSPRKNRFADEDRRGLESVVKDRILYGLQNFQRLMPSSPFLSRPISPSSACTNISQVAPTRISIT